METKPASAMLMGALMAMLLATAAAMMLVEARTARAAAGEAVRLARTQLAAERLLAQAIARLDSGEALAPQGLLFSEEDGARVLRQDAAGLVDLNAASPTQLAALITALGVEADTAATLADRIIDWRDEDDARSLHGAERTDYADAGLAAPGNRAFVTEAEVRQVMGVTPALSECLLPYLTTYSGQSELDPAAVSPRLAAMLNLARAPPAAQGAPLGRVIALTAEAPLSTHALIRRTLWLRLTGDPEAPLLIHRATQDFAARDAAAPACDLATT